MQAAKCTEHFESRRRRVKIGNVWTQSPPANATRRTQVNYLKALWGRALIAALAICALTMPNMAKAQNETVPELSRDWNVRIGVYVFQSKTASDAGGRVGISGLAERTVYRGEKFDVNVGIGYNGFDRIYSVPVTGTVIFHQGNMRYGAGAGYSFNKRVSGRGSNGSVIDLLLGYTVSRGRNASSVDLRYFFVGGSSNELDGMSLTYGIRF